MGASAIIAGVGVAATIGSTAVGMASSGGSDSSSSGYTAASTGISEAAKAEATALQKAQFDWIVNQSAENYKTQSAISSGLYSGSMQTVLPYYKSGTAANSLYASLLGLEGYGDTDPTEQLRSTPGYEWTQSEGINALDKSAASKGKLFSGGQSKAVAKYATGLADTTYGSYMDRLKALSSSGQTASQNIADIYNNWSKSLNALGQNNVATQANASQNYANQAGSYITGAASAETTALSNALKADTEADAATTSSQNAALNSISGLGGLATAYGLRNSSSYSKKDNSNSNTSSDDYYNYASYGLD